MTLLKTRSADHTLAASICQPSRAPAEVVINEIIVGASGATRWLRFIADGNP